jgi:pimeloyl-ACP methyl ester carboxylesterase
MTSIQPAPAQLSKTPLPRSATRGSLRGNSHRMKHWTSSTLTVVLALCAQGQNLEAADTGLTSHFAKLGTNRIHYAIGGTGEKTLVFVHGWAGNVDFWREQTPVFLDKAKLVLIDLPGHGKSDKPRTSYTIDSFADAVVAVMRDAKVEKATLIGHSMGVPVICRAYAKAPTMVTALVPVDGVLRKPNFTPEQVERFVAPLRGPGYREHTTNFIGSMISNPGMETLRARVLADVFATPQHVMSSAMEEMVSAAQPNWDLKKVDIPVLIINAKNPMWTPEYQAYAEGLSPKAEYRVIEGPGHFLMLEKPVEFNALLLELLRKYKLIN